MSRPVLEQTWLPCVGCGGRYVSNLEPHCGCTDRPGLDPREPEWRPNPMRDCSQCRSEQLVDLGPNGYRCRRCSSEFDALQL